MKNKWHLVPQYRKYKIIVTNGFTGKDQVYYSDVHWDDIPESDNVKLFGKLISCNKRSTKGRKYQ
jgi:hypothetical protein